MISFRQMRYTTSSIHEKYSFKSRLKKRFLAILKFLSIVFIFHFLITSFLFQTIEIDNISMEPNFKDGDRILILNVHPKNNPKADKKPDIVRGDAVFFKTPAYSNYPWIVKFIDSITRFFTLQKFSLIEFIKKDWEQIRTIKRVVGLPNEKIVINNFETFIQQKNSDVIENELFITKKPYEIGKMDVPEAWVKAIQFPAGTKEITLGKDEYYVLGDNRARSADSRYWGVVKRKDIIGKAVLRFWPTNRFEKY